MDAKFLEKYGSWAVVTGSSSGIGVEFARQLAAKGLNVVLVARRKNMLEDVAAKITQDFGVECRIIECDLSQEGFQAAIFDGTKDIDVGMLVNNAGMNCEGWFYRGDLDRNLKMIQLNMKAPFILAYEFGKKFLEKGKGGIIFTSSISAFNANPYLSHYGATKAYILSLAESMNFEFKDKNVDVLAVCPGFTKSEMTRGLKDSPFLMEAEPVVKQALDSLGHKAYTVPGFINKAQIFLQTRVLGRDGARNVSGNMLKKMLPGVGKKKKKE